MKIMIIPLFVFFSSCRQEIKNNLIGVWLIDQILYKGEDLKYDIGINEIETRDGVSYFLPSIINLHEPAASGRGEARFFMKNADPYIYFIKTENKFFRDTFKIKIKNDYEMEWVNNLKYVKFKKASNM